MEALIAPLLPLYQRERHAGRAVALAVVVRTDGSTYRKPGALMLIATDGSYAGLLSGGCLESDLHEHALQVMASGKAKLITYDTGGSDDSLYAPLADVLRQRVGRLLNDKMPTGVAVSPAMNHGGPYPATGHPGFTAVGIPASLRRFAMLACYDNIRPARLPALLQDKNPQCSAWRLIDGAWTRADVSG